MWKGQFAAIAPSTERKMLRRAPIDGLIQVKTLAHTHAFIIYLVLRARVCVPRLASGFTTPLSDDRSVGRSRR